MTPRAELVRGVDTVAVIDAAATRLCVLGSVRIEVNGRPLAHQALRSRQVRLALALLAVEHRPVNKHELAEALWGDKLPASWEPALRGVLAKVRATVREVAATDADTLTSAFGCWQLRLPPEVTLDVDEAATRVRQAEAALAAGRMPAALEGAERAVSVLDGEFFPIEDGAWVNAQRQVVGRLRQRSLLCLGRALLEGGRAVPAQGRAESAIDADPLDEDAHRLLMQSLAAQGDLARSLRVYEECRRALATELGVSPSAETERLYRSLLNDETLPSAPGTTADGRNPGGKADLPESLRLRESLPLVGYRSERAMLQDGLREAVGGRPGAVVLTGEPGAGKSRLAADVAVAAAATGVAVLHGRCDEDVSVPYQPFTQALDWYLDHSARPVLGRLGGELSRLGPELSERIADLPAVVSSDPQADMYRLFRAVAHWLSAVAAQTGLLLVIDDLQWATEPTVMMLRHVLRANRDVGAKLLVAASWRDSDLDRAKPLEGLLGDIAAMDGVRHMHLGGIDGSDVAALIEAAGGRPLDARAEAVAGAIHRDCAGNPLFVEQVLQHLLDTGALRADLDGWTVPNLAELGLPAGVQDVVVRRWRHLSPGATRLLGVAAVVGVEVDSRVVSLVANVGTDEVIDAFDEAVGARLLDEISADRYGFVHAVVRATLLSETSASRRHQIHGRTLAALVELTPGDLPGLAHHALGAYLPGDDPAPAAIHLLRAAERTLLARAPAEAEIGYRQVLDLLRDATVDNPDLTAEATLGLGEALRDQSDPAARETLLSAARQALAIGDTDLVVRAALANHRNFASLFFVTDADRIEVLEAGLRLTERSPSPQRAQLLAQLAGELTYAGDSARRRRLIDDAEQLARAIGDPALIASVVVSCGLPQQSINGHQKLVETYREAARFADQANDPSLRVQTRIWYAFALGNSGATIEARRIIEEAAGIAEDASPMLEWLATLGQLPYDMAAGQMETTERFLQAVDHPGLLAADEALMAKGAIVTTLAILRGGFGDLADVIGARAEANPGVTMWQTAHLVSLCRADRTDEARQLLNRLGPQPPITDDDPHLHLILMQLSFSARALSDANLARWCETKLTPRAASWVHIHTALLGPLGWALAACAEARGDLAHAVNGYRDVLDALVERQLFGLASLARVDLAHALAQRGQPADRVEATAVAAEIERDATAIGAPQLVARARSLARAVT